MISERSKTIICYKLNQWLTLKTLLINIGLSSINIGSRSNYL